MPLMDAGIDSLLAANFVVELQHKTGLQLSPTLLFDHVTAEAVAQHLTELRAATSMNAADALEIVRSILCRLTSNEEVSPSMPLMDVGIDSLSAVQFVSELQLLTGLQLAPTLVFDHSTAEAVADHIVQLAGNAASPQPRKLLRVAQDSSKTVLRTDLSGLSGRWPGGASSMGTLWQQNMNAVDSVGEVPALRWTPKHFGDTESRETYMRTASFIATVDGAEFFDASLFAVSPAEATSTDPQQTAT